MVEFVAGVATAFALQLLALPGEKAQIIIAALATRYNPYAVVAGATAAFGGWTALEIIVGNALRGALSQVLLDAITGTLFVTFAVLLVHASRDGSADLAPRSVTDGGYRLSGVLPLEPGRLHGFVPSLSLIGFGEVGDKTQLVTIGLAAQYGAHPGIWVGEMLAIIPVSLVNALFFNRLAGRFDTAWLYRISAAVFVLFAADIAATYLLGISFLPI